MISDKTNAVRTFFDRIAPQRDKWIKKAWYYQKQLVHLFQFLIPAGSQVLEIGCGTGELLSHIAPTTGTGIDISPISIKRAKAKYPQLKFITGDAQNLCESRIFDYVVLCDTIGNLEDVQGAFAQLGKVSDAHTRIIVSYYNYLWEPLIYLAEFLGLKMPQLIQNWLTPSDIENLLDLSNLEVIKTGSQILMPFYIPLLSDFVNRYLAGLPFFGWLCLVRYFVARQKPVQGVHND